MACPDTLVFDGRPGIHQCNYEPAPNECFREDKDDFESKRCENVGKDPVYEAFDDKPGM
jgi:hypothetical protein